MEEEKKEEMVLRIQGDSEGGILARPEVNIVIPKGRGIAPKQNLKKPEKSIQLMQQKGMAGLGGKQTSTSKQPDMIAKGTEKPITKKP